MSIRSDFEADLIANFGSTVYDSETIDNMYQHTRNLINFYDLRCDVVIYEAEDSEWDMFLEWQSEEHKLMDILKYQK